MTNYISPESRKEVNQLMKPLREATTREERDKAREQINKQFTDDSNKASDKLN